MTETIEEIETEETTGTADAQDHLTIDQVDVNTRQTITRQVETTENESVRTDMVKAAETNANGIVIAAAEETEGVEMIATGLHDVTVTCSTIEEEAAALAAEVEVEVAIQQLVKNGMNLLHRRELEAAKGTVHRQRSESQPQT